MLLLKKLNKESIIYEINEYSLVNDKPHVIIFNTLIEKMVVSSMLNLNEWFLLVL